MQAYLNKDESKYNRAKEGILKVKDILNLKRMPTSSEVRSIKISGLDGLITDTGGYLKWAERLDLPSKKTVTYLSEDEAKTSILNIMHQLNIDKMPSSNDILKVTGNHTLHNYISRHGGYRYFAGLLNLELKESETKLGQDYEEIVISILESKGFTVERMTTGHPFDLLINKTVKIDVKTARPHLLRGESRVHTFGINKKYGSCDIYITVALDEEDNIEKLLVIPSHHLRLVTLCIGRSSKYDIYNYQFEYIQKYSEFFKAM